MARRHNASRQRSRSVNAEALLADAERLASSLSTLAIEIGQKTASSPAAVSAATKLKGMMPRLDRRRESVLDGLRQPQWPPDMPTRIELWKRQSGKVSSQIRTVRAMLGLPPETWSG